MGEICTQFEKEDEGAAGKERTFENIMDLMQQVTPHSLFSNSSDVFDLLVVGRLNWEWNNDKDSESIRYTSLVSPLSLSCLVLLSRPTSVFFCAHIQHIST